MILMSQLRHFPCLPYIHPLHFSVMSSGPEASSQIKNVSGYAYIGILLLLIPFFIIITHQDEQYGIEYNVPETCGRGDDRYVEIIVSESGKCFIHDMPKMEFEILSIVQSELDELTKESVMSDGPLPKLTVFISPRENAKFGDVVRIVDLLNERFDQSINMINSWAPPQ